MRRRMATPPPPHLVEHDAGRSLPPAGGTASAASPRRRTRLKLALASIPLVLAVILLLVNAFGGPDGSGGRGDADGPRGSGSSGSSGGSGGSVGAESQQAGTAAVAAGDVTVSAVQEGHRRALPDGGDVVSAEAAGRPEVPAGHRAVAVRFASPDAVDLVAAGDRIDIVGTDGSVLEANVEVLQDRSTEQATVLVLAVTEERAAELAAAAVNQDLTLLVTPEP
ncbi:hypothetical protein ACFFX0_08880 [Citricoccus parietis]|uniref:Flp pilus assembly protein RcpC/CpaB domain-containing protein n=1 Tax=Citricoccus parietis TaxID=592307 RepID=A0ABV5FX95_9MICC